MNVLPWLALTVLLLVPALPTSAADPAPPLEQLKNLSYSGFVGSQESVRLTDGRYEGRLPDGVRRTVTLVRDFRLTADFDGDGREEAVVLLAESRGGTGTWLYLMIVGWAEGRPAHIATALLGDRVQLRGVRIEGARLIADVVRAGPADAMCCPGELATMAWVLKGNRLEALDTEAGRGRLTLAALSGVEWRLRWWSWDEPVPAGIDLTFTVDEGRVTGQAACNRYFSAATAGSSPGDLTIGLSGSTKMACDETRMAAEARFLAQLAAVRKFSFVAGQLALHWTNEGGGGTMLFERHSHP